MRNLYFIAITFFFLLLLNTGVTVAQNQHGKISGRITTSDGKPGAFVSVGLKGTNKGTISDESGNRKKEKTESLSKEMR